MKGERNYMGLDGYVWWIGVVENRKDPLNLGRVQVRVQGIHTQDLQQVPSADLPWAVMYLPPNAPHGPIKPPREGQIVGGFYLDTDHCQHPVITGIYPGIPEETPVISKGFSDQRKDLSSSPWPPASVTYHTDGSGVTINKGTAQRYPSTLNEPTTPRLARNEKIDETFVEKRKQTNVSGVPKALGGTWTEPQPGYAAVYPYNSVVETESGHLEEFDDTPGAERIMRAHRSGTFYEIQADGTLVTKIVQNRYQITMADDKVYIMGDSDETVQGSATVYIKGNMKVQVDGDVNFLVKGDVTGEVDGNLSAHIKGEVDITGDKDINITATGTMTLKGATIQLNP